MTNGPDRRPIEDVYSSILVDIAESIRVAPRIVPEDFGPQGRYRLEELIGVGRDSHVYRAVDKHLSRPDVPAEVAIKVRGPAAESRTEALVGRSVVHDNVVRVIDHGRDQDGSAYVVQEFVDGGDLTDLPLPLTPRDSASLMIAIARGLQALHSAGNIHGDVKPSNILRTSEGVPKITDFDLAVAADLDAGLRGGNLAFMSPERLKDPQALPSPLADIYALGGLLHFFLTGRPPLGDRADDILAAHAGARLPTLGGIDDDLRAICLRALAPNPIDRYHAAEGFADDLAAWLGHRPLPWTNPSLARRTRLLVRRHPIRLVVAAMAAIALAASAGMAFTIATREIEAQRRAVELTRIEIDELNAKARRAIERFIESGMAAGGSQRGPAVFAGLVWVDWLADTPILGDAGPTLARDERIRSLTALRDHYRTEHQTGSLADAMAAYALAYSYLEIADTASARVHLAAMQESVLRLLPPEDSARHAIRAMEAVCAYLEARDANAPDANAPDLPAQAAALRTLKADLRQHDGDHSLGMLIDITLDEDH
jgi:hypothetical protein